MKWLKTEKIPVVDPIVYMGLTPKKQRELRAMYNKIDRIIAYFCEAYKLDMSDLIMSKKYSIVQIRKFICFFAVHTGAYSHDEIAVNLGYKDGKSSYHASKTLEEQLCVDSVVHKVFKKHLEDLKQIVNFTTIKENYGKHEVKD